MKAASRHPRRRPLAKSSNGNGTNHHAPAPRRFEELPDMCSPEEAREFLRLGKNGIYELLKTGALPCKRFGRLIRIPKIALME